MMSVNLLPWREKKREIVNKRRKTVVLTSILILVFFIVIIECQYKTITHSQRYKNNQLNREILKTTEKIASQKKWQSTRNKLLSQLLMLDAIQNDLIISFRCLDGLSLLIPQGITLDKIDKKSDEVTFFGCDESANNLPQLVRNMSKTKWITSFKITEIKQSTLKSDNVLSQFKLVFSLSDKI